MADTGLPEGMFNLVQGRRDEGIALASAAIDGLFTASAATGAVLRRQFVERPEGRCSSAIDMANNPRSGPPEDCPSQGRAMWN